MSRSADMRIDVDEAIRLLNEREEELIESLTRRVNDLAAQLRMAGTFNGERFSVGTADAAVVIDFALPAGWDAGSIGIVVDSSNPLSAHSARLVRRLVGGKSYRALVLVNEIPDAACNADGVEVVR